jgi:DNA-binding CsgD family transcriptional regulator
VSAASLSSGRHSDELIDRAVAASDVRELFATASERLRGLVPFDASVWLATDPATNLPTAPIRSENMGAVCRDGENCLRIWELEFLVEDVNLYSELARAPSPAGALRVATEDRPARSTRYREVLGPNGVGDELRAVLRADGEPWASIGLYREEGRPAFSTEEAELVAALSGPLGHAVRGHARDDADPPVTEDGAGPGLMLFSSGGELLSINDDARAWLEELMPGHADFCGSFGIKLPMVVAATLMRAQAIAEERDHRSARARLRSAAGRWVVCHASCLRHADGVLGDTALVIEPAQAAEVAPIVIQAYGLTGREREITALIAQGFGTAEIADRLYLSPHTVRDYVKAVFDKVGVSSRGELVAKLFAEHYAGTHLDPRGYDRADD